METEVVAPFRYVPTTALKKVLQMRKRYRFATGGTDAAKTSSILQNILDLAMVLPARRIDVVGKSIPRVRDGAWEDTQHIIAAQNYEHKLQILKTPDLHIILPNKTEIHFLSFDTVGKAHGPRRDILFLNEANYIPWPIARELITRTREIVFADWNPTFKFWAYDEFIYNPSFSDVVDFITLTYRDNESLPEEKIIDLERRRSNAAWWRIYGEGLLGHIEGQIFNWDWIERIPMGARQLRRGLDFGFTNDPTALVDIYEYEGGIILDERCYQTGMLNPHIADFLGALEDPSLLVIADSSEPKSIAEIREFGALYGVNILPVQKYAGSKLDMVNFTNTLHVSGTTRSQNLREEVEQYLWIEDPITGQFTNNVPDGFDHAIDASLYGISPWMATLRKRVGQKKKRKSDFDFSKRYGN